MTIEAAGERPAIQVESLRKVYRGGLLGGRRVEALRGVTFSVGRGEVFGLLGPNGAGKTTLIKVLLGIVGRSGGSATLLGRPAGDRRGRREVGYLPENHRIPRHHTGNTALEYYGSLSGLPVAEIKRRRGALLELVGLDGWGRVSVRKYSKGMLQRLGLAQAMLHDPQLLVLDEPTDGVDPVGRSQMRSIFERLKAEGKTVFINSHLLQEVELVCDRVVILVKGQALAQGRVDQITLRPETEVTFTLAGAEGEIRAALDSGQVVGQHAGEPLPAGPGQYEVTVRVASQEAVDRAIDALRSRRISIAAMSRRRQTLEEVFLHVVNTKGQP